MPWFCPSSLPFPDALLSLTQAHIQHRHGPVAQAVFFQMVMGFPHHLQVIILKGSTICRSSFFSSLCWIPFDFSALLVKLPLFSAAVSTVDYLHLQCKYLIVYGWIVGSNHLDLIRAGAAAAGPSFHGGHPQHDPHKELQADKGTCSIVVHVREFFVMMKPLIGCPD